MMDRAWGSSTTPARQGRRWRWGRFPAALAPTLLLLGFGSALAQPPPSIHYVYDDLNRLVAVVDQQGSTATYAYDAVGNILAIERFDTAAIPGPIGITLFAPGKGRVGTAVEIFGKGLSATGGATSVTFNGTPATVTTAAPNRVATSVPAGAISGPITVTSPLGSATSARAFTVLRSIVVSPSSATVAVAGTRQFEVAEEGGGSAPSVRWSVNGTPRGDATFGAISDSGLYTAPAAVPTPATVTVTATHGDDSSITASASVTIVPPTPLFLAAPAVSVGFPAGPTTVDRNVGTSVSVVLAGTETALATTPAVGLTFAPVVTAIIPASGARGAAPLGLSVSGGGLAGASALTFLRDNIPDLTIAVTSLAAAADGRTATAEISIAAGAPTGDRVVQITTPEGTSTAVGTGGNVFNVQ